MLKIISKINCPRCENIKQHLDTNNIPYEVEMAEDKGYGYWRDFVTEKTGQLGFPIVFNGEECVNGSSEEIVEKINFWNTPKESGEDKNDHIKYAWGRNKHGESSDVW